AGLRLGPCAARRRMTGMEPRNMSRGKATAERATPGRLGLRLRWTRIATLAAVLLIHLGFLAFLLAPSPGWRWPAQETSTEAPDALLVRMLPVRTEPVAPPQPASPRPVPHAHRPPPVALPTLPTAQA